MTGQYDDRPLELVAGYSKATVCSITLSLFPGCLVGLLRHAGGSEKGGVGAIDCCSKGDEGAEYNRGTERVEVEGEQSVQSEGQRNSCGQNDVDGRMETRRMLPRSAGHDYPSTNSGTAEYQILTANSKRILLFSPCLGSINTLRRVRPGSWLCLALAASSRYFYIDVVVCRTKGHSHVLSYASYGSPTLPLRSSVIAS